MISNTSLNTKSILEHSNAWNVLYHVSIYQCINVRVAGYGGGVDPLNIDELLPRSVVVAFSLWCFVGSSYCTRIHDHHAVIRLPPGRDSSTQAQVLNTRKARTSSETKCLRLIYWWMSFVMTWHVDLKFELRHWALCMDGWIECKHLGSCNNPPLPIICLITTTWLLIKEPICICFLWGRPTEVRGRLFRGCSCIHNALDTWTVVKVIGINRILLDKVKDCARDVLWLRKKWSWEGRELLLCSIKHFWSRWEVLCWLINLRSRGYSSSCMKVRKPGSVPFSWSFVPCKSKDHKDHTIASTG